MLHALDDKGINSEPSSNRYVNMENSMNRHKLTINPLKALTLAAMICFAFSSTTMALSGDETFTFSTKSEPITSIGGDEKHNIPYSGWHWTGNSTAETSTGKKNETTFSCVMMSQPPNDSLFQAHTLCDIKAKDGSYSYSAVMGCTFIDAASGEVSCVGGLYGTGGVYSGRRGSITNHAKGGVSSGTGQWYK